MLKSREVLDYLDVQLWERDTLIEDHERTIETQENTINELQDLVSDYQEQLEEANKTEQDLRDDISVLTYDNNEMKNELRDRGYYG